MFSILMSCTKECNLLKHQNRKSSLFIWKKNLSLYSNLNTKNRTIFIQQTVDNFRAAKHFPTEQISFDILNISGLINSPYGQFTTTIYRGGENRSNLTSHCSGTFKELDELVKNGIDVSFKNGTIDHFNVIVFFSLLI